MESKAMKMKQGMMNKVRGGYIVLSAHGIKTRKIPVRTADQAIAVWESFRDSEGLASSDLKRDSGALCEMDGTVVARISYNGRVWDKTHTILLVPDNHPFQKP